MELFLKNPSISYYCSVKKSGVPQELTLTLITFACFKFYIFALKRGYLKTQRKSFFNHGCALRRLKYYYASYKVFCYILKNNGYFTSRNTSI